MTRWWGAGGLAVLLLVGPASAQSPVVTLPKPATTAGGNVSGTITTTNTFQRLWPNTGLGGFAPAPSGTIARSGCTIINNGTHSMYVTEGLGTAASTTSNSVIVPAGGPYYCGALGGPVLTGEIDITGTSGDAFYAAQY